MTNIATISKFSRNCMGTIDIYMKIPGMHKEQEFTIYPISKDSDSKQITIQSHTRIGRLNIESGKGLMSANHASGAYFHHFSFDKLSVFELSALDLQTLKMQIFVSSDKNAVSVGISCDNSGAIKVL